MVPSPDADDVRRLFQVFHAVLITLGSNARQQIGGAPRCDARFRVISMAAFEPNDPGPSFRFLFVRITADGNATECGQSWHQRLTVVKMCS